MITQKAFESKDGVTLVNTLLTNNGISEVIDCYFYYTNLIGVYYNKTLVCNDRNIMQILLKHIDENDFTIEIKQNLSLDNLFNDILKG